MKKILLFMMVLFVSSLRAQDKLPLVYLPDNSTIHFISPELIQYVDISGKQLVGDLPLKNVLRLKLKDSSGVFKGTVITVAGEKFIAQYRLLPGYPDAPAEIEIVPAAMRPLDISGIGFSQNQLRAMATNLIAGPSGKPKEKAEAYGIRGRLNHIYTLGDYIFLDISYQNRTRIKYDIADLRFSIDDKKVTKAANSQSIGLKPELALYDSPAFSRDYRNIFVLKKLSIPGNKVLHIELSEQQVSGRVLSLAVSYQDILDADVPPKY